MIYCNSTLSKESGIDFSIKKTVANMKIPQKVYKSEHSIFAVHNGNKEICKSRTSQRDFLIFLPVIYQNK